MVPVNLRRRIEIGDQIQIEINSEEQLQQMQVFLQAISKNGKQTIQLSEESSGEVQVCIHT